MTKLSTFVLILSLAASCFTSTLSFSPSTIPKIPRKTHLSMTTKDESNKSVRMDAGQTFTATIALATCLMSGLFFPQETLAISISDETTFGDSSVLISGRSGGRMGGRASFGGARMGGGGRSMYSGGYRGGYRGGAAVMPIRPMIAPPVMISPFGFGYNPMGGFGLGYGLGAMGGAGGQIRDIRQEGEIQRSKTELEEAKKKEAELELRIKQLEQAQGNVQQSAAPAPAPAPAPEAVSQ